MKFTVLASGSTGNSTFIETPNTKILIDIGTSSLYVEKKLKEINVDPSSINAIIITHTHIDHISGLRVFLKKYHPTLYITKKMYTELKETIAEYNKTYISFSDKTEVNINFNKIGLEKGERFEAIAFIEQEPNSQMSFLTELLIGTVGEIKSEVIAKVS